MTGNFIPSKTKSRGNLNPYRCRADLEAAARQDPTWILGWDWAGKQQGAQTAHWDPPEALSRVSTGKCSKLALAAAVSDILKAWKKWKILGVLGPRDYLGSADVHGLRTQQYSEAVGN